MTIPWHPISSAPRDGTSILLFSPQDGVGVGKWVTQPNDIWEQIDADTCRRGDDPATAGDGMSIGTHGWQPIETAPKDGTYVLLHRLDTKEIRAAAWMTSLEDGDKVWVQARGFSVHVGQIAILFHDPDYWQPLPQPPVTA